MNRKKIKGKYRGSARLREERPGHIFHRDDADKKKLGWFYVLVDLLLVLLVTVGAVLVYTIWAPFPTHREYLGDACAVRYTLEISDIKEEFAALAREGMPVEAFGTGELLGTVESVEVVRRQEENEGEKCVLLLTLTAEARYLATEGYFVGAFRAAAGNKIEIRFDNVYGNACCIGVAVKE